MRSLLYIIRVSHHMTRTKRYIRNFAYKLLHRRILIVYVRQEVWRGDEWMKLVGYWKQARSRKLTPC